MSWCDQLLRYDPARLFLFFFAFVKLDAITRDCQSRCLNTVVPLDSDFAHSSRASGEVSRGLEN